MSVSLIGDEVVQRTRILGIGLFTAVLAAVAFVGHLSPLQPALSACVWGDAEYAGPPAQRVALVGLGSDQILLTSRRHPAEGGSTLRQLTLHTLSHSEIRVPAMPDDYEWVDGVHTADGDLLLFWTTGRQRQMRSDTATAAVRAGDDAGIHTAALRHGEWNPAEAVYRYGRVQAENSSGVLTDARDRIHLAVTAHLPRTALPGLLHVHGHEGEWSTGEVATPGVFYPQLARLAGADMVLVSIGAVPGQNDGNSVWSIRFDAVAGGWQEPVLISRSGAGAAFEPALLASGSRVDAVWTRDLDGARSTRESLWHAYSLDAGRSWSRPAQIAAARHIWRPALTPLGHGPIAVVYLVSEAYGSPGVLNMMALDRSRWRRSRRLMGGARMSDFAVAAPRPGELVLAFATYELGTSVDSAGVYHVKAHCGRKEAAGA